ncbi:hypothetical protein Cgig2_009934 [Carnegiea gigantea]|uniref:Uncharacterized protein n=1 Tax=Carnegiea gigantea TaxID=171969 RepID=A0A9Q1QAB7_9CARY|nr:hypothetical protein Cgig2_009934 [Carnegiea gigantea]
MAQDQVITDPGSAEDWNRTGLEITRSYKKKAKSWRKLACYWLSLTWGHHMKATFFCRLNKTEIIEPLILSVLSNLERRHLLVRWNVILIVMSMYKCPQREKLLGDAPETIEKILSTEQEYVGLISTRRGNTLVSLSLTPVTIRAAIDIYCNLLQSWSADNAKFIIFERLHELKSSYKEIMAQSTKLEKNREYQQMLVLATHICALKFPKVASVIIYVLMDFLGGANVASTMDVVVFKAHCHLRHALQTLWIIRECYFSLSEVESGVANIQQCPGDLPFYIATEEEEAQEALKSNWLASTITVSSREPMVLAVGVNATQSATLETVVVACTLTKLVLKRFSHLGLKQTKQPPMPYYINGICGSIGVKDVQPPRPYYINGIYDSTGADALMQFVMCISFQGMSQLELEGEV